MKKIYTLLSIACFASIVLASCGHDRDQVVTRPSLYDRVGGDSTYKLVVDKFTEYVLADTAIKGYFAEAIFAGRVDQFKINMINRLTSLSGGPQHYTGKDMITAHLGMKIPDRHFDAFVNDLTRAMEFYNIGFEERNDTKNTLEYLRKDIVNR